MNERAKAALWLSGVLVLVIAALLTIRVRELPAATLTFTHSGFQSAFFVSAEGDTEIVCSALGDTLRGLLRTRLYFCSLTGGPFLLHHEKLSRGLEGQADTLQLDPGPGGNAYLTDVNGKGESCPSAILYVPGTQITGVPTGEKPDRLTKTRFFTIKGEYVGTRLWKDLPSGIYIEQRIYESGRRESSKRVLLK